MKKRGIRSPVRVFVDPGGRRRRVLSALAIVLILGVAGWAGEFVIRVYQHPPMPMLQDIAQGAPDARNLIVPAKSAYREEPTHCGTPPNGKTHRRVAAFLPANDPLARADLEAHCDAIDLVLDEAALLMVPSGQVEQIAGSGWHVAPDTSLGPATVPVLEIPSGIETSAIERLLMSDDALAVLGRGLAGLSAQTGSQGVCLDLSSHGRISPPVLGSALRRMIMANPGLELCLIAPLDAPLWMDVAVVKAIQLAIVQGFRGKVSPAVSPAAQGWLETGLQAVRKSVPPDKLIVALGTFGLTWQSGSGFAQRLRYAEVMERAATHDTHLNFSPDSGVSKLTYLDQARRVNEIWLFDAVSLFNQTISLGQDQALALWPLGSEDPAVWPLLAGPHDAAQALGILNAPIKLDHLLMIKGGGPFAEKALPAQPGTRHVIRDPEGERMVSQHYGQFPEPNRLIRAGRSGAGEVVPIFIGLPRAEGIAPLMRIVDDFDLRATFFVDGSTLLQRRDAADQLLAAGHLIGVRVAPDPQAGGPLAVIGKRMSGNAVQMLLTQDFGLHTRLVLEQHGEGPAEESLTTFLTEKAWRDLGYLPVMIEFSAPYGPFAPQDFVARVLRDRDPSAISVLSFDLSANNEFHVVASLPKILSSLKESGVGFATLPSAAGISPNEMMPKAEERTHYGDGLVFGVVYFVLFTLNGVFLWLLAIATARAVLFLTLALVRRRPGLADPDHAPTVTVVIPAYNEERVILACINSLLRSNYRNFHILVVDDGSTDRTAAIVERQFGRSSRVTLLRQSNRGKWRAANAALSLVRTPVFVVADADSLFQPDTLGWLLRAFRDPRVGAVAGVVEVGNRVNLLTDFQAVEYIVSQSVMRRAYETFNGILVVPGAVGAWRTEAVLKAGGFSGETITEDADLTVAVHRAGYHVRFEERARALTEAPETLHSFLRQRLRWSFGMLQVSWKHRAALFEGRAVGLSIMDAIWFAMVTGLLSPLVDLMLLVLLAQGAYALGTKGTLALSGFPAAVLLSYTLLTMIDIVNTLVAFAFEKRFEWKLLLLVPLMRFGYRQLLYVSAIRALLRAAAGLPSDWQKLDRSAGLLRSGKTSLPVLLLEPKDRVRQPR